MEDSKLLSWLIDRYDEAEDASTTARQKAERDVDYYDGKQLTKAQVEELKKRGQPAVVLNMIRDKIDYLQGMEREQRTKPRALPNKPQHDQASQVATDALQSVCQENQYDEVRSAVWGDLLKAGWGGYEIGVEMHGERVVIVVNRCQWDRMYWDPYSQKENFADTGYQGLVVWMDRDQAVRKYGDGAGTVFDETVSGSEIGGTFDDKPKNFTWVAGSASRRRIRVIQKYYIGEDGEWNFCEFTKGGILKDGPSPWLDEDGKREHPYVWRGAYVDRDNNRYGPIRDMIDPQDEMTQRRSFLLHAHTTRQTFGNAKFGNKNLAKNKKALSKRDGHVELVGEAQYGRDFGIVPNADQSAGHAELLAQTTAYFENKAGPNAAMMGKKDANESGRAIIAQQKGGAIQMGTLTDALRQMDFDVYRKIWNRIRQFWTEEMHVRVTDVLDGEHKVRFVGLNVTKTDEFGTPIGIENSVEDMDVDIEIDDMPAGATVEIEQFEGLVSLAQAGVKFPPQVYIQAMPGLRDKQKLIQLTEAEQQAASDPTAQKGAESEIAGNLAKARLDNAKAEDTELETGAKKSVVQKLLTAPPPQAMPGMMPPGPPPQAPPFLP